MRLALLLLPLLLFADTAEDRLAARLDLRLFEFRLIDLKRQLVMAQGEIETFEQDLKSHQDDERDAPAGTDPEATRVEREIRDQQRRRLQDRLGRQAVLCNQLANELAQLTARVAQLRARLGLQTHPPDAAFAVEPQPN